VLLVFFRPEAPDRKVFVVGALLLLFAMECKFSGAKVQKLHGGSTLAKQLPTN
jgi:hypothetical protein